MVTAHYSRKLLREAGVDQARFVLDWASAAEAPLYVELITKFTNQVKALGPLGEAEGVPLEELRLKLAAARSAAENVKLRTRFARLTHDLRKDRDYSPQYIESKMSEKLNEAISREMEERRIP
jgi:hypothetical protein